MHILDLRDSDDQIEVRGEFKAYHNIPRASELIVFPDIESH